jgi:hypothetical protein
MNYSPLEKLLDRELYEAQIALEDKDKEHMETFGEEHTEK